MFVFVYLFIFLIMMLCTFRYEKKKDEEIRNYDPFGRGGGGAPMRDRQGNIIGKKARSVHLVF